MSLRKRKANLIRVLQAHQISKCLTAEQVEVFSRMYSHCKSEKEQDEVTAVVRQIFDGWKTATDRFSRMLQNEQLEDCDLAVTIPPHARWK